MKKLWLAIKICVKALGDLFDFLEPYALALDEPVAWVLTVASVAMGVISLYATAGGWSTAMASIWLLISYVLCPATKIGSSWKALICGLAIMMLSVMEKLVS